MAYGPPCASWASPTRCTATRYGPTLTYRWAVARGGIGVSGDYFTTCQLPITYYQFLTADCRGIFRLVQTLELGVRHRAGVKLEAVDLVARLATRNSMDLERPISPNQDDRSK